MEALDKHNLTAFVRARESYSWMFLERDFDQVARMAVPGVFAEYNRQFEGDGALQKKIGAAEEWRINIVGVRLRATDVSDSSKPQGQQHRRAPATPLETCRRLIIGLAGPGFAGRLQTYFPRAKHVSILGDRRGMIDIDL